MFDKIKNAPMHVILSVMFFLFLVLGFAITSPFAFIATIVIFGFLFLMFAAGYSIINYFLGSWIKG